MMVKRAPATALVNPVNLAKITARPQTSSWKARPCRLAPIRTPPRPRHGRPSNLPFSLFPTILTPSAHGPGSPHAGMPRRIRMRQQPTPCLTVHARYLPLPPPPLRKALHYPHAGSPSTPILPVSTLSSPPPRSWWPRKAQQEGRAGDPPPRSRCSGFLSEVELRLLCCNLPAHPRLRPQSFPLPLHIYSLATASALAGVEPTIARQLSTPLQILDRTSRQQEMATKTAIPRKKMCIPLMPFFATSHIAPFTDLTFHLVTARPDDVEATVAVTPAKALVVQSALARRGASHLATVKVATYPFPSVDGLPPEWRTTPRSRPPPTRGASMLSPRTRS
uniref:Uncharacterized protein n=2 Tax=Zea mays TaxID=4577 RepID=A0A804MI72_MAIZE